MTDDTSDESPSGAARKSAVARGYDDLADAYDEMRDLDQGEFATIDRLRDRLVADGATADSPARLLDAGCGAGRGVLERVADDPAVDALGLDASREQARRARQFAPTLRGDLTRLPFRNEAVDALTAFHATIHVPRTDHPETYREFERVLRPDGHLLLTVGMEAWEGSNSDWLDAGAEMHWSYPGAADSRRYLREAGFTIEQEWAPDDALGHEDWPVWYCQL